jgi:hypothetical protein
VARPPAPRWRRRRRCGLGGGGGARATRLPHRTDGGGRRHAEVALAVADAAADGRTGAAARCEGRVRAAREGFALRWVPESGWGPASVRWPAFARGRAPGSGSPSPRGVSGGDRPSASRREESMA